MRDSTVKEIPREIFIGNCLRVSKLELEQRFRSFKTFGDFITSIGLQSYVILSQRPSATWKLAISLIKL